MWFLILFVPSVLNANPKTIVKDCVKWFSNKNIKPGQNCVDACVAYQLGAPMNILCSNHCTEICKTIKPPHDKKYSSSEQRLLRSLILYPLLTEAEKDLIQSNPKEAYIVFKQKNAAERITGKYFPDGSLNDESDAFRHYIWSGLLVKELGVERALKYLDAHESNPKQPVQEKAMDLANNRVGTLDAQLLQKKNSLTEENIIAHALKSLKEKKLVVLEPQNNIPEETKP